MKRRQELLLTVVAILPLALVTGPRAAADLITMDESGLVLLAGRKVELGKGTSVVGAIAAGKKISAERDTTLQGLYTGGDLSVGKTAVVRGRVLANGKTEAEEELDFQGASWTGRKVEFDRDALIVGDVIAGAGDIEIDRGAAITGSLLGNRDISIDRDSVVYGDVSPGLGYDLSTGRNVTIAGSIAPAAVSADTFDLPEIGPAPPRDPYGSENVHLGNNADTALAPGAYRDVDVGNGAVLTLRGGVYDLKNFSIKNNAVVNVDTTAGDVLVNADGFKAGNDLKINIIGKGRLAINAYSTRGVWIGKDSYLQAEVHAYGGDFRAGDRGIFRGTILAAGDVSFGNGSIVVPEPGAAIVLAAGGVLILRRKRPPGPRRRG